MMKLLSMLMTSASAEEVTVAAETVAQELPLMSKGLIVTAAGLAGVFLVLFLFFFMIKLMQKIIR